MDQEVARLGRSASARVRLSSDSHGEVADAGAAPAAESVRGEVSPDVDPAEAVRSL
jgi:hypothetical protein